MYKTNRNQIKARFRRVYQCGYCELQYLNLKPEAYTRGVYGWNYDVINLGNGVAVLTGYRGMFGAELPEAAEKILKNLQKYELKHCRESNRLQEYRKRATANFKKVLAK